MKDKICKPAAPLGIFIEHYNYSNSSMTILLQHLTNLRRRRRIPVGSNEKQSSEDVEESSKSQSTCPEPVRASGGGGTSSSAAESESTSKGGVDGLVDIAREAVGVDGNLVVEGAAAVVLAAGAGGPPDHGPIPIIISSLAVSSSSSSSAEHGEVDSVDPPPGAAEASLLDVANLCSCDLSSSLIGVSGAVHDGGGKCPREGGGESTSITECILRAFSLGSKCVCGRGSFLSCLLSDFVPPCVLHICHRHLELRSSGEISGHPPMKNAHAFPVFPTVSREDGDGPT